VSGGLKHPWGVTVGLLLSHKRKITLFRDLVTVSEVAGGEQSGGGKRGEVSVFSSGSRFRLFRLLHTLKFETMTFCTLTYPAEFPTDPKIYKAHLKEWRRRYEERFGKVPTVWRLEFQTRGAPHYHLLQLDAPFAEVGYLSELWASVVHSCDEAHKKIGVDVKLITKGKEARLIATYIAKYVAKIDNSKLSEQKNKVGRWWGKWNIEEEKPIEIEVPTSWAEEFVEKMTQSDDPDAWKPAEKTRCTIFGSNMGTDETEKRALAIITAMRQSKGRNKVKF